MEILVIRHGQSQADLEDRHEGRADFPLTELGMRQASLLAEWCRVNYPPELIISSPMKRTSATAQLLSEATGSPLEWEPDLVEWNNGLLAGLTRAEAQARFPRPAGGRKPHDTYAETESLIDFRARAERFWSRFTHGYILPGRYKRIALVSHGGMINLLFRCFLALPVVSDINFVTGDTGVHLWLVEQGRKTVVFTNRLDHLRGLD
ncbi:MAG TPA: histidine phosphatase family protein [Firmicutes bacterium]|jgi:2,3-bisphosphoglycerate-dependent phosphoglycerate mutase|nr:histidine phosphatase family protein [Bacillota bacterium]